MPNTNQVIKMCGKLVKDKTTKYPQSQGHKMKEKKDHRTGRANKKKTLRW